MMLMMLMMLTLPASVKHVWRAISCANLMIFKRRIKRYWRRLITMKGGQWCTWFCLYHKYSKLLFYLRNVFKPMRPQWLKVQSGMHGCILHCIYFSPVKEDGPEIILQQTAFCTWVFECYPILLGEKKKLSQDDPILGFYHPLSSSLQGPYRIFSACNDSCFAISNLFFMQLSASLSFTILYT